jgi:integrase
MISLHNLDSAYLYNLLVTIQTQHSIPLGHNCKSYISQIFSFAISLNKATRNPVSDLTGLLQPKKIKHYPAITDPAELGKYLSKAQLFKGSYIVAAALHLTPLIFCRPGELRQLEWSFVNWDEARLEIPSHLMKMKVDHIVPLSTQALSILVELKNSHGNNPRIKHIFPSPYKSQNPISGNTVSKALRSIGYSKETITPHGFRATARTLLDEVLEFPIEIIEQQLAHTVKDVHGRAYNRTKHLKQRAEMMQAWADYLDSLISS